jgi:7,8-dihydropterin-6-yl-methyl-4-(beta-D-ribofuranosyl)aminobenzene 5'-phosphate synthase
MSVSVTIVVENTAQRDDLATEHGLSMYIESEGTHILFDTGQGQALEGNAETLGIDLSRTDVLILSHGHYDHTGGIPTLMRVAPHVQVYAHPQVNVPRYAIREGRARSIGIPAAAADALEAIPDAHLHMVREPRMLTSSIGMTGPVPRITTYEDTGGPFFLDSQGERPDPIDDDMALWIATDEGLVVCLGCAHSGVVNTLEHITRVTGEARIRAVIGGLHLMNAGRERMDSTIAALRRLAPQRLFPCHCTGESAVKALRRALGDSVTPGTAGATYRF